MEKYLIADPVTQRKHDYLTKAKQRNWSEYRGESN